LRMAITGLMYTWNMTLDFLKPRSVNTIITLVIVSLPLLREHAVLPSGGYEIARYRPIFLLVDYLQMKEWYPFLLILGFCTFIYIVVSGVVAIGSLIIRSKKKRSRRKSS
ncbi:hypothetical protein WDW89_05950, partial [Deltaproteobacteria bacterium TL4]